MEKENKGKRSYKILLAPDKEAVQEIDKKMLRCQRLYAYLTISIKKHISYLKKRTEYGSYSHILSEAIKQIEEYEKEIRSLSSDEENNKDEIKELKKEITKIKKENSEWFMKKIEFFRNNPLTLIRFRIDSRRARISLLDDCLTPSPDSGFTLQHGCLDGKPYYINDKTCYQLIPGSIHKTHKGITGTLCESVIKTVPAVFNEATNMYTFEDMVWSKDAVINEMFEKENKKGETVRYFRILFPVELFRIDSSNLEYKSLCAKYTTERVYSLNRNPQTNKTQKTNCTYYELGISSTDLAYSVGNRLYMSYKDFPYERNHTINDYEIFTSGSKSTTISISRDDEERFSVLFKPTSKRTISIPIADSPNNRNRHINPELNFDWEIMNTAWRIPGYKSYSIIKDSRYSNGRKNTKYFIGVTIDDELLPRKLETDNSLNRMLGKGNIGIDPNAHMIAAVSGNGSNARIFCFESVSMDIYKKMTANKERIEELKREASRCLKECNPKAIDENGKYIKGCGLSLFKSKRYQRLNKEIAELQAKNTRLKKVIVNMIAHEILGMGDTVYSELPPTKEKAAKKKGIKKNESGKILSNHGNGRSVQEFSIAGLIAEVKRIFVAAGGKWFWIADSTGATCWMGDEKIEHSLSDRVLEFFGHRVQRDMKSGLCLGNVILGEVSLTLKGKPKMYGGEPVYRATFDEDSIRKALPAFVESNNKEMLRLKNIGVEEETVGVKLFFGEDAE